MQITRKVLITTAAYVATTVIGFIGTLFIARILGASGLGTYALGLTLIKWLIISDLGLRKATKKRLSEGQDVNTFYSTSVIVHLTIGLLLTGILFVFKGRINAYLGGEYAELVILMFVSTLLFELIGMGLSGIKKVHIQKSVDALTKTTRVPLQIGLILVVSFGVSGLFIGHIISLVLGVVIGGVFLFGRSDVSWTRPSRSHLRSLYSYAKFSWADRIRSQSFAWMDLFVLGLFVSSTVVGIYQLAWTIAMTLRLLPNALGATLFPELSELSEADRQERVGSLVREGIVYTTVFPIPGLFGVMVLGDEVLRMFGPEFVEGVAILTVLAGLTIINSFGDQLRVALDALDYPEFTLKANAVFVVANLILNFLLIPVFGGLGAAIATTIAVCLGEIYAFKLLRQLIEVSLPLSEIGRQVVASVVMASFLFGLEQVINLGSMLTTFLAVGVGAVIYTIIIIVISPLARKKMTQILNDLGFSIERLS